MYRALVIANTAEAFSTLLEKDASASSGQTRIRHEHCLGQRALLYGGGAKVVVTSEAIPQALIEQVAKACRLTKVANVFPVRPSLSLSADILCDSALVDRLVAMLGHGERVIVSPYAVTAGLRSLIGELQRRGVNAVAEGDQTTSPWLIKYLDSKAGFRIEAQKCVTACDALHIPEAFLAVTHEDAESMVEWFHQTGRSAVVKVNEGESGWGLCIVERGIDPHAMRRQFRNVLASDAVWESTLLVVEEFIDAEPTVGGGSPSVELIISDAGPRVTYCCGQLLHSGQFYGIEMGVGVLPSQTKGQLKQAAMTLGWHYHKLGYRGFFDVDFVAAKNELIYAVETNTRRTGGTHVYDFALRVLGTGWEDQHYICSHDSFSYGVRTLEAEELLARASHLLFPNAGASRGIVITCVNPIDPMMGYIVVDRDKGAAGDLRRELMSALRA